MRKSTILILPTMLVTWCIVSWRQITGHSVVVLLLERLYTSVVLFVSKQQHITSNAVCVFRFPERAVAVLQSGCLSSLLLRSLYTDREFWDSRGGASGLRPLIHTVERRGQILLQHIRDRKLQLNRDLWLGQPGSTHPFPGVTINTSSTMTTSGSLTLTLLLPFNSQQWWDYILKSNWTQKRPSCQKLCQKWYY